MIEMEKCDILINGCRILQPDMTVSEELSVAIHDSWIKKIGPSGEMKENFQPSETLDGTGKLLMPGLVDGHTHTCQQLLRGGFRMNIPWFGPGSWFRLKVT